MNRKLAVEWTYQYMHNQNSDNGGIIWSSWKEFSLLDSGILCFFYLIILWKKHSDNFSIAIFIDNAA